MASGEARKERLRKRRQKSPNNRNQRRKQKKMVLKTLPQYKKGHKHAFNPQVETFMTSSPISLKSPTLEQIKQKVRSKEGVCYEKSINLIEELKTIGDKAVLMGVMDIDGLPFHFYVQSQKYGVIDIYPEGNPSGDLNGIELDEKWTPPDLMNRIWRIINIELYRFEGALLDDNAKKCKEIYKSLVGLTQEPPREEKMKLQDEVLQHLGVALLALKRGKKVIAIDRVEKIKDNIEKQYK